MIRRAPQRSTSQPMSGRTMAAIAAWNVKAAENAPRLSPRSSVSGFRNTPKVKTLIGPAPTTRPQTVANTTHQRLPNSPVITCSFDPPAFQRGLSQHELAICARRHRVAALAKGGMAAAVTHDPADLLPLDIAVVAGHP